MDLNKAMVIGRLTRDPEMKTTPNGQTVTSFSIATGFSWTDQSGQKQEKTEFRNVVTWRKLAEICGQYLTKGKRIYLEGRIQTRDWVGQDGVKRYRTEIIADNMIMLDGGTPRSGQTFGQNAPQATAAPVTPAAEPVINVDEDINSQEPSPSTEKKSSDDEINVEEIPF